MPCGQMFGMAEGMFTATPADASAWVRQHTVGTPISPADEVRILEIGGEAEVPDGEIGELACRGPYTIPGYYRAPAHNAATFTADGFYRTGDLAVRHVVDGTAHYAIEGRIKDVINRGAEKIHAEEVEEIIVRHPDVHTAALVAMPDPVLGERACAFLILEDGAAALTVAGLGAFLREQGLAKYKLPERVEIVDELPLTTIGKVAKKELRERLAKGCRREGAEGRGARRRAGRAVRGAAAAPGGPARRGDRARAERAGLDVRVRGGAGRPHPAQPRRRRPRHAARHPRRGPPARHVDAGRRPTWPACPAGRSSPSPAPSCWPCSPGTPRRPGCGCATASASPPTSWTPTSWSSPTASTAPPARRSRTSLGARHRDRAQPLPLGRHGVRAGRGDVRAGHHRARHVRRARLPLRARPLARSSSRSTRARGAAPGSRRARRRPRPGRPRTRTTWRWTTSPTRSPIGSAGAG